MISVIITAREEKGIGRAIEAFQAQGFKDYEMIISAPDKDTIADAKRYAAKNKRIRIFRDSGLGKSHALNQVFKMAKGDIIVLSDGDVVVDKNAVKELLKFFSNKRIGCVSGRPVPLNAKSGLIGYWCHLLATAGAHKIRKKLSKTGFLECSAYLFAFRNLIKNIPTDVAEDAIIPYLIWKKSYRVAYAEKAYVYVKNPTSIRDFIRQRKRTANAHTKLTGYAKDFPRMKSFFNECKGCFSALSYPKTYKEFCWTLMLIAVRLYIWASLFADIKLNKKEYTDRWERVDTAR